MIFQPGDTVILTMPLTEYEEPYQGMKGTITERPLVPTLYRVEMEDGDINYFLDEQLTKVES